MHWSVGLAVACNSDDRVVVPLAHEDGSITAKVERSTRALFHFFGGCQITVCSSYPVFPHCACSFHFFGCQVGKELVGCEEVVEEEVVLCPILPNNFNHVIDDPRAEGLVAGCCLLAFVDLQVVRIAVRTAKAPELVPKADGLSTNEHLRTVAPKVWHYRFINRQIFVEHSKFGKGGVNAGVNWSNLRNFVALLQVVDVRKVNAALDIAKTCPAHCL